MLGSKLVLPLKTVTKRASTRVLSTQNFRSAAVAFRSFSSEKVPEEDYYDGHLMVDHLEYMDDMLDKTLELENSMNLLKETYAKKKEVLGKHTNDELHALFEESLTQKEMMINQIAHLKGLLTNAHNVYAVDAPDGTSDNELQRGMKEVDQIIDYAAEHEDVDAIDKKHEMQDAVRKEQARDPEHDW